MGTTTSLSARGIVLLDYLGDNVYLAFVSGNLKAEVLRQSGVTAFHSWLPSFKLHPLLASGQFPSYAVKIEGTVDVQISIPIVFSIHEAESFLLAGNFAIVDRTWAQFGQLTLRIDGSQLQQLASFPFIQYIEPLAPEPQPLNNNSRQLTNAGVLNSPLTEGGKGLNGEGVCIGIGDNGDAIVHVDFSGRVTSRTIGNQNHGVHVSGTAAGAGIGNELYRGFAPRAALVTENQTGIISNTALYAQDFGMVLTNNSYAGSLGCESNNGYDLRAHDIDLLSFSQPSVLHVFAAGNSGDLGCSSYPPGFNTISSGFQCAKNVLTVGSTNDTALYADFSSKGPVTNGRLKPEIVAHGNGVVSTQIGNGYNAGYGTSMASPAVTGGAALLYQRYRQLHNNTNPANALIKALLCDGADDRGNPGPDYSYGYGTMNLLRSIDMLEQQHYYTSFLSNASSNSHNISVPANTAQLKVMLYWNDPAALPVGGHILINDLDVELTTPVNGTVLPLTLDTLPANVNNPATNAVDHINNIEQIVIDHPLAGNYNVKVKGTAIAQGPQEYFLVYDIVPFSLNVTYPTGGEAVNPAQIIKIRWDAYGNPGISFTIEYSIDNGNNWTTIANNISAGSRAYAWQIPNVASADARIRISQNGTGLSAVSQRFTIIDVPVLTVDPVQCEGSILIHWNSIPGATDYEVMMLRGTEMQTVSFTNNTDWNFNSLSPDSVYWVSVRARINGRNSRRAIAISRQPNNGDCSLPVFDNDLKLDSILTPSTGRKFTSSELHAAEPIKIRIKNLDNITANGFTVQYSVNGGPWNIETVNIPIAPLAAYEHVFSSTVNLSQLGSYTITAVVKNLVADPITLNDTFRVTVRQIDNQPLSLNTVNWFFDDLENSPDTAYETDTRGLVGLDRYDFENLTSTSALRTFMNTGTAYSGRNSFIMGETVIRLISSRGLNVVTGTYNLSGKSVTANDIRLTFLYLVTIGGNNNDVWIRGSDVDPWIKVFDFNPNLSPITSSLYKQTGPIEITDSLIKYGQDFSASFQVRWQESHFLPKFPRQRMYSIDDIGLAEVKNDLQMTNIDNPTTITCGLNNAAPVVITVYNSHNAALTNVPVQYSINNGAWVTEIIPSIAANTKLQYTFVQGAHLDTAGIYTVKTVVAYPGDTYRLNDTLSLTLRNNPMITSYPHLQDFESGNAGWYAEGSNSSWEFGTPSSISINRAASGTRAWKTRLSGHYNPGENSYLYSPCYQLSGMIKPTLSFSMAIRLTTCTGSCDLAWMEYSVNGGPWVRMNGTGGIINWYNNGPVWSAIDQPLWHVVTTGIPVTTGTVRFRFALATDFVNEDDGIAIDDIHVYDGAKAIYDEATMTSAVTQQLSGNQWIDAENNGKLIASIHPGTQNLGNADVQAYINTGAVRHIGSQYYHDRNITIKPSATAADSVSVRLYYLDSETNNLLNASGCALCTKPRDAYRLGISAYRNVNRTLENGIVEDDSTSGTWTFIHPSSVKHVPFGKGYYAEFKMKGFSEIWLNDGGLDTNSILVAPVFVFTAQRRQGTDVLLKWITGDETEITKYEIEVARGIEAFQAGRFAKIGESQARHATSVQSYDFTDIEADKFGVRYYRLKIIYADNSFMYSEVRFVNFDVAAMGKIYPNPSADKFNFVFRASSGNRVSARVINLVGQVIRNYQLEATGFEQTLVLDLYGAAAGIYFLQVDSPEGKKYFKLVKTER